MPTKKRFFASAWYPLITTISDDSPYHLLLRKHFNSIFWIISKNTWLAPYTYNLVGLDFAKQWQQTYSQDIRYGGVIGQWIIPKWFEENPSLLSKSELHKVLEDFIKVLFDYQFHSYDFLLEKIGYDGKPINDIFATALGGGYEHLDYLLEYASSVKKNSRLILSDFGYKLPQKWGGNLTLLKRYQNKNFIDGVSIQVQINVFRGAQLNSLSDLIKAIQDLGYEVELPEITVWENAFTPADLFGLQEKTFNQILDIVIDNQIKTCGILSPFDAHPWNFSPMDCRPGFFYEDYTPKPWSIPFLQRIDQWLLT